MPSHMVPIFARGKHMTQPLESTNIKDNPVQTTDNSAHVKLSEEANLSNIKINSKTDAPNEQVSSLVFPKISLENDSKSNKEFEPAADQQIATVMGDKTSSSIDHTPGEHKLGDTTYSCDANGVITDYKNGNSEAHKADDGKWYVTLKGDKDTPILSTEPSMDDKGNVSYRFPGIATVLGVDQGTLDKSLVIAGVAATLLVQPEIAAAIAGVKAADAGLTLKKFTLGKDDYPDWLTDTVKWGRKILDM